MLISTLTVADVPLLYPFAKTVYQEDELMPHLLWCLHTPFARAWKAMDGEHVAGVCAAVCHADSGWLTCLWVGRPWWEAGTTTALARAALAYLEEAGCTVQRAVMETNEDIADLEALGFVREGPLVTYWGGTFYQATRDEVVMLEPQHLLGALHLDRRCTGEDRRALLLEQLYMGTVYVEDTRVRGLLLPLNGSGLLVADTPDVAFELQRWMLPLQESVTAPAANTALAEHMTGLGYKSERIGIRLVRGTPALPYRPDMLYAGGGWG